MKFLKNLLNPGELLPLNYVCTVKCKCECTTLNDTVDNSPNTYPTSHTVQGTKKP